MKSLIIKIFIIYPLLLLIGCCNTPERTSVPNDFKKYFIFPNGSYWVYKNQHNEFDTLVINNYSSEFIEDTGPESCSEHELVEINYYDSYLSIMIKANIKAGSVTFSSFYDNQSFFPDLISDTTFLEFKGMKYSFNQGFINNIQMNGFAFNNIYSVTMDTTSVHEINSLQPILGFYVRDIGLIKRVLFDGTIWELVDYKVNK